MAIKRIRRIEHLSLRERLEQNQRAICFQAGVPYSENDLQKALPPKRERVRRPVDGQPVGPTEHQEQCAVIQWWRNVHPLYNVPEFALFAVPNGGARDAITGARLKSEGVRSGALDLILAIPSAAYAGLFIELKVRNNQPSDKQKAFVEYLNGAGYKAIVHWSADAVIAEIKEYLA